jgi:hypothetical protein
MIAPEAGGARDATNVPSPQSGRPLDQRPQHTPPNAGSPTFAVALHRRGVFSGVDERRSWTWPQLVARLTTWSVADVGAEDKKGLPCWSPVEYGPGDKRRRENVIAVSCAVADFDGGITLDEAHDLFKDWPYVAHTSYRHADDAPRFRLILPLARPVPAALWARAWHWLFTRTDGRMDGACKEPHRAYLLPVHKPGAPHESRVHDPGGWLLDLLDIAERLPPTDEEIATERAKAARATPRPVVTGTALTFQSRHALAILEMLCDEVAETPEGARNTTLNTKAFKAAGLVKAGYLEASLYTERMELAGVACGLAPRVVADVVARAMDRAPEWLLPAPEPITPPAGDLPRIEARSDREYERKLAELLKTDVPTRLRLGAALGGYRDGNRAYGLTCPKCREPGAWFWIEPSVMVGARCSGCGWRGWLDQLAAGAKEAA